MRALLLPLLLIACTDAPDVAPAESATVAEATPVAEASPATISDEPPAETPEASDPDLTTPGGLLQAFQTAAASGDATAFEPYLELDPADREMFDEYIAASLLPGGEWHESLMALTVDDLEEAEGGAYTASMLLTFEEDGDTFESAILLRFAQLGEEYRVIQTTMAG